MFVYLELLVFGFYYISNGIIYYTTNDTRCLLNII